MTLIKKRRLYDALIAIIVGIGYVYFMSAMVAPRQNDLAHGIGLINLDGGKVFHSVEYRLGDELLDQFTFFLTATVIPPLSGDFEVVVVGPEELNYEITSRYPPAVAIANRLLPWYKFENGIFKGVTPNSDLVISFKIDPPEMPGSYSIFIQDVHSGQIYLEVPLHFLDADGNLPDGQDCH